MPILQSEIKFYKSTSNLGGAITATEILSNTVHNLFDKISSDQALLGTVLYKCFYVKNVNASITLENAYLFLETNTPSPTTVMEFGIGTAAVGVSEQLVPDEFTAPTGVVFTPLIGADNAEALGNLPASGYKSVWLKLTVSAGTAAVNADGVTITVTGDTGA